MLKKIIAIIILIGFIFVPLATVVYVTINIGHICHDADLCSICPSVLTKRVMDFASVIAIAGMIIFASAIVGANSCVTQKNNINLIQSKIRMNN